MAKRRTVFKEIPIIPYVCVMWLIITNDPHHECAMMNQRYKNLGLKWPSDAAAWTEDQFYMGNYLSVVFDASLGLDVNTIAHEAIHIKNAVMKHSGIKHDFDNDEPEAYLTGWISEQIYRAWKEL